MTTKPFPKPPHANAEWDAGAYDWNAPTPPAKTACKHGLGECEQCGTTDRRDARHTTRGGRGVVARALLKR